MRCSENSDQSLKILHLEDDPNDVELIRIELQRHHCHCQITPITTKQAFEAAIKESPFDVIISDCRLPGFDTFAALRMARQRFPAIPFIFVSGHSSPEIRQSALDGGATAFVSKDRLSVLIAAIEQLCAPILERIRQSRLPKVGQAVLVRCKGFRCMASLHPDGKWRDSFHMQELPEVLEWFEV